MDSFNELLIDEVSSRPVLYDKTNKHYKDQSVKMKAWAEIASVLGGDLSGKYINDLL